MKHFEICKFLWNKKPRLELACWEKNRFLYPNPGRRETSTINSNVFKFFWLFVQYTLEKKNGFLYLNPGRRETSLIDSNVFKFVWLFVQYTLEKKTDSYTLTLVEKGSVQSTQRFSSFLIICSIYSGEKKRILIP